MASLLLLWLGCSLPRVPVPSSKPDQTAQNTQLPKIVTRRRHNLLGRRHRHTCGPGVPQCSGSALAAGTTWGAQPSVAWNCREHNVAEDTGLRLAGLPTCATLWSGLEGRAMRGPRLRLWPLRFGESCTWPATGSHPPRILANTVCREWILNPRVMGTSQLLQVSNFCSD